MFRRYPWSASCKANPYSRCKANKARLAVECLEGRELPAVTFHGGPVLSHVEIQPLFLGSEWATNPNLAAEANQITQYLQLLTNSSYMDMLTWAGYGVGRGQAFNGAFDGTPAPVDPIVSADRAYSDTWRNPFIRHEL